MDEELPTLEQVLDWLPRDIAAEFDCIRGPHEWVSVSSTGTTWTFCKHCTRKKVIREWGNIDRLYGLGA